MSTIPFTYNDGGRQMAGYTSTARDCVTRAIGIATGLPYQQVYVSLAQGNAGQRKSKHSKRAGQRTANHGIITQRKWFKDYMSKLGFTWVPTMGIGTGCKVHL